jgi:hypothetical protein
LTLVSWSPRDDLQTSALMRSAATALVYAPEGKLMGVVAGDALGDG